MKDTRFLCPFCHKITKLSRMSENIVRCLKCGKTGDKKEFVAAEAVHEAFSRNTQKELFGEVFRIRRNGVAGDE